MPIQMLAAIDVGSSEVAMKIYQFSKRTGIQEVEYVRSIVELGADTYNTGIISYDTAREPVSYTHLDVYKRQFLSWAFLRIKITRLF